jgi:AraC-like DNA-binding protein
LSLVDAALRGMVVALLAVLAWALARARPQVPATRAGVALAIGLVVQVIGTAPMFEALAPRGWQAPFVAVSVGNGVMFWVFVQALFDDDFALGPLHVAAWVGVAALSGFHCAVVAGSASPWAQLSVGVQRMVPLVFAVLATFAAASHWRGDLLEPRRRLRAFVVVTGIGYTLLMFAARLGSRHGELTAAAAVFDIAALLTIVAVVAGAMLRLRSSELFTVVAVTRSPVHAEPAPGSLDEAPPPDPAEARLVAALHRVMTEDRAYRDEIVSVASLAPRLGVPEYRLRRLINQRLGHRNFNAFVNTFRLADARSALADPAQRETPILAIALDAGFQSIGPFNRAFKAATGQTPSEFRRDRLAVS